MSQTISPRKLGVGGFGNFSSDANTSRGAIKTELQGRLLFDDERVDRRLRLPSVDQTLVDDCYKSFFSTNEEAIQSLRKLEEDASKPKGKAKENKAGGGNQPTQREKDMYPHLVRPRH